MRIFPCLLVAALLFAPASRADDNDCIAIIGTGSVGGALGPRFAGIGEKVVYGSRTPDEERVQKLVASTGAGARAVTPADAAAACRRIVLAVPWEAVDATLGSLGALEGKLIIDVTNPLDVKDDEAILVETPGASSGGEYVQMKAPGARVVKAFNTLYYRVMEDPALASGPVSVPLAGDDAAAKSEVAALVSAIGLEPLDVGKLRLARYTEAMAILYVNRLIAGQPFEFHLRARPRK